MTKAVVILLLTLVASLGANVVSGSEKDDHTQHSGDWVDTAAAVRQRAAVGAAHIRRFWRSTQHNSAANASSLSSAGYDSAVSSSASAKNEGPSDEVLLVKREAEATDDDDRLCTTKHCKLNEAMQILDGLDEKITAMINQRAEHDEMSKESLTRENEEVESGTEDAMWAAAFVNEDLEALFTEEALKNIYVQMTSADGVRSAEKNLPLCGKSVFYLIGRSDKLRHIDEIISQFLYSIEDIGKEVRVENHLGSLRQLCGNFETTPSTLINSYKREVYERCPLPEVDQLYIGILDRERPRLDTHPIFFTNTYYDYDANAWQRGCLLDHVANATSGNRDKLWCVAEILQIYLIKLELLGKFCMSINPVYRPFLEQEFSRLHCDVDDIKKHVSEWTRQFLDASWPTLFHFSFQRALAAVETAHPPKDSAVDGHLQELADNVHGAVQTLGDGRFAHQVLVWQEYGGLHEGNIHRHHVHCSTRRGYDPCTWTFNEGTNIVIARYDKHQYNKENSVEDRFKPKMDFERERPKIEAVMKESLEHSGWDPEALLAEIGVDRGVLAPFHTVVLTYSSSDWAKYGDDRGALAGAGLVNGTRNSDKLADHEVVAVKRPRGFHHFFGQSTSVNLKAYFFI